MKRRSLFQLFAGAVMASAMEVCGWRVPKPRTVSAIDDLFMRDAQALTGRVFAIRKLDGPLTSMFAKGPLPEGMGYNYSAIT